MSKVITAVLFLSMAPCGALAAPVPIYSPDDGTFGGAFAGDLAGPMCRPSTLGTGDVPVGSGPLYLSGTSVGVSWSATSPSITVIGSPSSTTFGTFLSPFGRSLGPTSALAQSTGGWDSVAIEQSSITSKWIFLSALTPFLGEVEPPAIVYPPDTGSRSIYAVRVYPGSKVTVTFPGGVTSSSWVGASTNVSVPVPVGVTLASGQVLTMTATLPGSAVSTTSTVVSGAAPARVPVLPWPVRKGATQVMVSGVVPGSFIEVVDSASGSVVGSAELGGPAGVVPTCALTSSFRLRATRNAVVKTSATFTPWGSTPRGSIALNAFADSIGTRTTWEQLFDLTDSPWDPPPTSSTGGIVYRVVSPLSSPSALMFIIHGIPEPLSLNIAGNGYTAPTGTSDHFMGYDYLQKELAKIGIRSISLPGLTSADFPSERAELLVDFIDWYRGTDPTLLSLPLVVAGQSVGGEAAFEAAHRLDAAGKSVAAVVALSPTTHRLTTAGFDPGLTYTLGEEIPSLVLFGDEDYFTLYDLPYLAPWWFHDRSPNNAFLAVMPNANHSAFSSTWFYIVDEWMLDRGHQEQFARRQISDWLDAVLFSAAPDANAAAALSVVGPTGIQDLRVRGGWKAGARVLIDNFGDADAHFGIGADPNASANSLGKVVSSGGSGSFTELVPTGLRTAPGNRVLHLQWNGPSFFYTSRVDRSLLGSDFITFDIQVNACATPGPGTFCGADFVPPLLAVSLQDTAGVISTVDANLIQELPFPLQRGSPSAARHWSRRHNASTSDAGKNGELGRTLDYDSHSRVRTEGSQHEPRPHGDPICASLEWRHLQPWRRPPRQPRI